MTLDEKILAAEKALVDALDAKFGKPDFDCPDCGMRTTSPYRSNHHFETCRHAPRFKERRRYALLHAAAIIQHRAWSTGHDSVKWIVGLAHELLAEIERRET